MNKRFEIVRNIIATLEKYGVTDGDFEQFKGSQYNSGYKLAATLEAAKQEDIDEAIDLCSILNSLDQPRGWLFRRKPSDETTKALVRRLQRAYWIIAG